MVKNSINECHNWVHIVVEKEIVLDEREKERWRITEIKLKLSLSNKIFSVPREVGNMAKKYLRVYIS